MNVNVLIVFYSRYGNTRLLADAIAEGAQQAGADVRVRRVADLAPENIMRQDQDWWSARAQMSELYSEPTDEDLLWADAIVIGCPTRFGSPPAELKLFLDKLGPLWFQGKLVDKVGSAFVTTGTVHGGNEMTVHSLLTTMMHFGMIIVPPGYADTSMFAAGAPYGASAVTGPESDKPPTEVDLAAARFQGKRTAERALMLKIGKASLTSG
ncbi:MAG: NAD(P)H:quinone oxidoreductase [Armatimonadota bacterium]|nr:NAD(P)H:quinone oxidoreductase [Armatimonadota bacterium]